ncbi:MAG: TonB-dependent receptor [Gammaproteobacteria bacterium]|nr:TonB-dependent receptor [Gammaproteobacteria bacterium]
MQDTPISITAFTGEMLERQGITSLDGVASSSPNVEFDYSSTFSGANAASVYMRGIGQVDFTLTTEPGVGIYLDGVYISQSIGSVLSLVDIETVKVLRGPQGTLFGRNTIGGAINVRSKLPDDQFHGDVELTGGAYDRIDGKVNVNVPLSDTLYAKASFASLNRDGFVAAPNTPDGGDLGDEDKEVARLALRFVPNDQFEANFSVDYTRQRENGVAHILNSSFEGESLALIGSLANPASPTFVPPPGPLPAPSFVDLYNLVASIPFGQTGGVAGLVPGVVPNPVFGQPAFGAGDTQPVGTDDPINGSTLDLSSNSETWGVGLSLEYDLGWSTIKSISSYREMEARTGYDNDASAIDLIALVDKFDTSQFSQEIQLSGLAMDDRLNWVLGFYHFEEEGLNLDDVEFTPVHILSGAEIDNRSTAAFAQLSFDATEKLSLTAGLRYTDEEKKYIVDDTCHTLLKGPETLFDGTVVNCAPIQTVINPKFLNTGFLATVNQNPIIDTSTGTIINPQGLPLADARVCCIPISDAAGNPVGLVTGLTAGQEVLPRGTTKNSFDDLSPHASIAYRWHEDFMTYFSYSEGFKSGGFVQRVFPPKTEVPSFAPENVQVLEVGFKWTGFDNRVRLSAAGFHTQYDDLQIQINDGIAPVTRNAAAAEIDGFEIEVMATPAEGWLLQGGVGYLDARYTELDPNQNFVTDIRGITLNSNLVNAPDWSASAGAQYSYRFAHGGELITRLDWSYRSAVNKDALNFPSLAQDAITLLNAGVTYISADDKWEVSAFGKNITDERYIVSGFANGLAQATSTVNLGRPAEWGLSVKYRFGE